MMRRLRKRFRLIASSLIGTVRKSLLGDGVIAVVTRAGNGIWATDPEDMFVGRVLREGGAYGEDELHRVFQYVGPRDSVLVVGAHVGALVVPIAKRCKDLVAIEANPATFQLLKLNLLLNSAENVTAHNVAASASSETIEFVVSRNNSGGSKRMPRHRAFEYFYDSPDLISVPADALDEFLQGQTFAIVIMDIEGSEYFALRGMQSILRDARALFVEYLPHHLRNVSGVTPEQFLGAIEPHFANLEIPSKALRVGRSEFLGVLQSMFAQDQNDDGIIFSK